MRLLGNFHLKSRLFEFKYWYNISVWSQCFGVNFRIDTTCSTQVPVQAKSTLFSFFKYIFSVNVISSLLSTNVWHLMFNYHNTSSSNILINFWTFCCWIYLSGSNLIFFSWLCKRFGIFPAKIPSPNSSLFSSAFHWQNVSKFGSPPSSRIRRVRSQSELSLKKYLW